MHATVELVVSRERRRDAWSDVLIACRDERAGRSLQARACVADTLGLPGKRPLRPARTALRRTALRASRASRDRQSSVLLRLLLAVGCWLPTVGCRLRAAGVELDPC